MHDGRLRGPKHMMLDQVKLDQYMPVGAGHILYTKGHQNLIMNYSTGWGLLHHSNDTLSSN